MRKLFILFITLLVNIPGFAQRITNVREQGIHFFDPNNLLFSNDIPAGKTTAAGDTFTLKHITPEDTLTMYAVGVDSGYVTGTDYWGDQAFAEEYTFNGYDSSMEIIGVFALFGGTVNPASTDTISFDVWYPGGQVGITGGLLYNGFPGVEIDSQYVPITQLGIGATDTLKMFWFDTPTYFLPGSFFVGYNYYYLFDSLAGTTTTGNDIGLACSKNGERLRDTTYVSNVLAGVDTTEDTILNVQNATLGADNIWYDNYTQNDGLYNNLAIYPIVVIGTTTAGVNKITRSNLTFYGNYPNPADNNTNIKFSLAANEGVTIQLMDMNGHLLNTIQQRNLATGEHIIPVATSDMPSGDYLYLIRTSDGTGIAGKMTVLHP